jgi:hypothetical protein
MRMLVVGVFVVGALAAMLGLPSVSSAQTATQDFVSGDMRDCTPASCPTDPSTPTLFTTLAADARSGPSGESPSGTMRWDERVAGDARVNEAQVTCLSVTGNVAIVGVTGTETSTRFGFRFALAGFIRVTDGGGPASNLDIFELAVSFGPLSPPPPFPPPTPLPGPTDCSAFPSPASTFRNDEGDLVVSDAHPLPTSKQQCKNGGWKTFGVFKNQGQCVSLVATGGKNPPGGP